MDNQRQPDKKTPSSVCGYVNVCTVKKCIHREAHQFNDACKGMCKHMGYAECRRIK